jgi:hypothetical protein
MNHDLALMALEGMARAPLRVGAGEIMIEAQRFKSSRARPSHRRNAAQTRSTQPRDARERRLAATAVATRDR